MVQKRGAHYQKGQARAGVRFVPSGNGVNIEACGWALPKSSRVDDCQTQGSLMNEAPTSHAMNEAPTSHANATE